LQISENINNAKTKALSWLEDANKRLGIKNVAAISQKCQKYVKEKLNAA
jgi:hypothetical protein